jgi:teichuronic acid biosynthesis glycosyltransferase TuaC
VRILTVTNMYPHDGSPSFGIFVREQVEDLRRLGAVVDVLPFDGRRRRTEYADAARRVRVAIREARWDVVHAHYGLAGAVALAQTSVPVVTTFHGSDTGLIRWQRRVSWLVARRSTPIFVERGGAERLGVPNAAVIPCGVDLDVFRLSSREEARARLGWDRPGPHVLLPGSRSVPHKGPELFDAVVGRVRESLPTTNAVALEGFTRDQVRDVLNAVDVTLMTSLSEGAPVAVKESLACETPVVSVPVGDVERVVAGLPGCAIRPRDVRLLAQAVIDAIGTPRTGVLRARAGRYERRAVASRVLHVLADAADGGRQ